MRYNSGKKAAAWSFVERVSSQAISFLIGVVLARLLSPKDYGIVGLTAIFIALSNVFVDSGFANALIRKPNRTERDLSTAFYFNVVIGLCSYSVLWICAPLISDYFDETILVSLIRIVGLNVLLYSLCVVQTAQLTAQLNIRLQTIVNICGQLPAGILAIVLAYYGWGVYALAIQTVFASFIRVILLWICAKWRPHERFNKESFFELWRFGSCLLGANLIGTLFNQMYSVLIGKYIGKSELGYFSKASGLNSNVDSVTSGVVQKVALPLLAVNQADKLQLTNKFREIMCLLVLFIAPLSSFLCFTASDIVILLWTDKWIQCAVLFQLLIVGTMFNPIGQMSLSLIQAVGQSNMILKLEFPKKAIYCIYIVVGFAYGLMGLVVAQIFINVTGALINMWATKRIIPYSYYSQLSDLLKYMVLAFSFGWISSYFVQTQSHILNVVLIFFMIFLMYAISLLLIKDVVFSNFIKKIIR